MVSVGEAYLLLRRARDIVLAATGNSQAAASIGLLADAANGLVNEMGSTLVEMARSGDAERRSTAAGILRRLHEAEPTLARDDEADGRA